MTHKPIHQTMSVEGGVAPALPSNPPRTQTGGPDRAKRGEQGENRKPPRNRLASRELCNDRRLPHLRLTGAAR